MFWERFYNMCTLKATKPNPVAKEIGISSGIVTKWKTTGTLPNGETLAKIADYLDCSVDYLLGHTNTPNAEKPAATKGDELSLDPLDAQLMDLLPHLTDDQKKLLYAQIKTLLDTQ